jgi:hypothetical protein
LGIPVALKWDMAQHVFAVILVAMAGLMLVGGAMLLGLATKDWIAEHRRLLRERADGAKKQASGTTLPRNARVTSSRVTS